ncbi:OmpA-like transmembrane domain protein [Methylobrevis pamukkalensis]|uniref:OmpA-like transmembrane domain protein n=2 Tax=Methylobrevis pamukkalensis TaxID=1439726 RepID=A0A1E3H7J7_9HYPH|nr:OmpA-like transmembrane domain protein [Methylobrevis pamukkalensis]
MGSIVFGLEADFDASGMDGSGTDNNPLFIGPVHGEFSLLWQGSVRARLGYAVDRLLVYGTGGFAYGNAEVSASVSGGDGGGGTVTAAAAPGLSASEENILTGWTVGAGVEYAFTDALSARLEYRYTDLGEATYSATTGIGAGSAKFGVTYSQVLAGISYRF